MTLYYVPQYIKTQLSVSGGIDDSQTTGIVLQSITGIDYTKPGILAINWSDPLDTTKVEYLFYTSINDSTKELQGVTRGQEGYSAKSHVNGATVAWPLSKSHINNINEMFYTTGLETKQIATPANPSSGYNKLYFKTDDKLYKKTSSGVETEIGAVTVDGWTAISGTFTYASSTTINVSSGAASIYHTGDKIRFQNNDSGTYLYAYIITVADTLLTVKGDAVPNATLTDAYYSHQENPLGFPTIFSYTPAAVVGFSSTPVDSSYRFSLKGRVSTVFFNMSNGASASNSADTSFTLPIAASADGYAIQSWCAVYDNGVWILSSGHIYFPASATVATVCKAAVTGGDWTSSGNKSAIGQFSYMI